MAVYVFPFPKRFCKINSCLWNYIYDCENRIVFILTIILIECFCSVILFFSKTMWQVIFDYEVHCDINNVLYILTCM